MPFLGCSLKSWIGAYSLPAKQPFSIDQFKPPRSGGPKRKRPSIIEFPGYAEKLSAGYAHWAHFRDQRCGTPRGSPVYRSSCPRVMVLSHNQSGKGGDTHFSLSTESDHRCPWGSSIQFTSARNGSLNSGLRLDGCAHVGDSSG
jgi:hypothetical protein